MLDFDGAMRRIGSLRATGVKHGTKNIAALCALLGDPQKQLRFVHVAGTNGKGSVCALLAAALTAGGYRTGLYTSPYVLQFRERFQIDGEMISPQELARLTEKVWAAAMQLKQEEETVTEFEFITALAFCWFLSRRCDIVVLETGIGGLQDATNVILCPETAVITSISKDHSAQLGESLEEIAAHKAGIIKPGGDVVVSPGQEDGVWAVLKETCRQQGARLHLPDDQLEPLEESPQGNRFLRRGREFSTRFGGRHQLENAAAALTALDVLSKKGFPVSEEARQRGFGRAFLPARTELFSRRPLVLLDGGHNPGSAKTLKLLLSRLPCSGRLTALMGMMRGKDSRGYLQEVGPLFSAIRTVTIDDPHSLSAGELAAAAGEFCPDARAVPDGAAALKTMLDSLQPQEGLVVCGSFYLAGELRRILEEKFLRP